MSLYFLHQLLSLLTPIYLLNFAPYLFVVFSSGVACWRGSILREISRHICETDIMIIDVYTRFLPEVAVGYEDPRVQVHISNGS
ncbi:hypothetical protein PRUPE_5G176200 [Prunus persica]|uniref:Uncharacterized protein n=1 Tax=Prunus persica TaxID=3760 RepID=A0A251PDD6_PRUPE|nr:hypothetical protein PRUPE_5G176200 [Prunus persica]